MTILIPLGLPNSSGYECRDPRAVDEGQGASGKGRGLRKIDPTGSAIEELMCFEDIDSLPFLPEQWKWKTTLNWRHPFSTSMIMGGRVDSLVCEDGIISVEDDLSVLCPSTLLFEGVHYMLNFSFIKVRKAIMLYVK